MRLRDFPLLLIAAGGCASVRDTWEYRAGIGFVNEATREHVSAETLLAQGVQWLEEKSYPAAIDAFTAVVNALGNPALRERALFLRGRAFTEGGDPHSAYLDFDRLTREFRDSDRVLSAREQMMACALRMAREGHPENFLFISVSTSSAGVKRLREALARFPAEEFSDDYRLELALFFIERGDLVEAESELTLLTEEERYRRTNSAPRALLLLARIALQRFDGVSYDVQPLSDARRYYEKFLGDYGRFADDPAALAALRLDPELLERMVREARAGLRFVTEKLAEKELEVAKFYLHRGRPESARRHIDAVQTSYPDTAAASEARALASSLEP
ncbi:MAG: outer membrane protein assembly factor BamD [Planctomycetes bacterium]|nr:outer membrane protein assembly factor BamD [Planctomycetota bacterium]